MRCVNTHGSENDDDGSEDNDDEYDYDYNDDDGSEDDDDHDGYPSAWSGGVSM